MGRRRYGDRRRLKESYSGFQTSEYEYEYEYESITMRYILFTKLFREQSIEQLIETAKRAGVDGLDLCVRNGYPVNPGNARVELPKAAKRLREAGLIIPMISAATDLTDPSSDISETLFRACHDAGIRDIKIGYWPFKGPDYWKQVAAARKQIEAFAVLGSKYGVRTCLHTHSGSNLGVNASALMHLLRGMNPSHVAAYLDPGHLALNGEPLPMAFDMTAQYLALVAIKDANWEIQPGKPRRSKFVPLGEGLVDWSEMLRILHASKFQGPLSFHSEYDDFPAPQIFEQTKRDVQYMRKLEAALIR